MGSLFPEGTTGSLRTKADEKVDYSYKMYLLIAFEMLVDEPLKTHDKKAAEEGMRLLITKIYPDSKKDAKSSRGAKLIQRRTEKREQYQERLRWYNGVDESLKKEKTEEAKRTYMDIWKKTTLDSVDAEISEQSWSKYLQAFKKEEKDLAEQAEALKKVSSLAGLSKMVTSSKGLAGISQMFTSLSMSSKSK